MAMSRLEIFESSHDPLRQKNERQAIYEAACKMVDGELPPEKMAQLPWSDVTFCRHVQNELDRRHVELQKHRNRFKALREVFGPGDSKL